MEKSRFTDDRYTALCSEKTLQSDQNGFFLQFAEHVLASAGEDWLKNTFAKLTTDKERIRILFTDEKVYVIPKSIYNKSCNEPEIRLSFR